MNNLTTDIFPILKQDAKEKGIAFMQSDTFRDYALQILKGGDEYYNHRKEITDFHKIIFNYFKQTHYSLKEDQVVALIRKYAYRIGMLFLQFLPYRISIGQKGAYFVGRGDKIANENNVWMPDLSLTSYGIRMACLNMDTVVSISDGVLVYRWHQKFEFYPQEERVEHVVGMPPISMAEHEDDIVAAYCTVVFKTEKGESKMVIMCDKQDIDTSLKGALANLSKMSNQSAREKQIAMRKEFQPVYAKRLAFLRLKKVVLDTTKIISAFGSHSMRMAPLSEEENIAEGVGHEHYATITGKRDNEKPPATPPPATKAAAKTPTTKTPPKSTQKATETPKKVKPMSEEDPIDKQQNPTPDNNDKIREEPIDPQAADASAF